MNPSAIFPNRHTRARPATLRQIAQLGPFIEGEGLRACRLPPDLPPLGQIRCDSA